MTPWFACRTGTKLPTRCSTRPLENHSSRPLFASVQKFFQLGFALGLSLSVTFSANCQPAGTVHSPTNRYAYRTDHDPDGIGKFYQGREIAHVMGHQAADWLERPERNEEEHSEELIKHLKISPGATVADIGAGTGYFSRRLAKQVGPSGKVLAVDIQPEMLTLLTNKAAQMGIMNISPVLGTPSDPSLPLRSVDLVLMVDVYHEFDLPWEMMQGICRSLKPNGRVVLVEFRGEDDAVPIKPLHKMTEAQVKKEMSALPLQWVETLEALPRQHIIIFKKQAPP
jgi:ubiquinone/menaquinone biosynthesis C-methylase UbiE